MGSSPIAPTQGTAMNLRGFHHPRSKIKDIDTVLKIRLAYIEGVTTEELAKQYGVGKSCLQALISGRNYGDIPQYISRLRKGPRKR